MSPLTRMPMPGFRSDLTGSILRLFNSEGFSLGTSTGSSLITSNFGNERTFSISWRGCTENKLGFQPPCTDFV